MRYFTSLATTSLIRAVACFLRFIGEVMQRLANFIDPEDTSTVKGITDNTANAMSKDKIID